MKEITGKIIKLGNNIDPDKLLQNGLPGDSTSQEQRKPIVDALSDGLPAKIQGGEVLVAGFLFGSGCSGAKVAAALKAAGIRGVIARSFGRDFFRQAINSGLPVVVANIVDMVNNGDPVTIDFEKGKITYGEKETKFPPYPEFVINILETGSLTAAVKKELKKK
ncbi:MAG: 3-isopropylmalate dehydratase [Candidatus Zixiibacteriota bacterium]